MGNLTQATGIRAMERIVQGTVLNSTSGTSIDFTGIPSWAKRITVMFNGVSISGTSLILVRLGAGSILSSGYSSSATAGTATIIETTGMLVQEYAGSSLSWNGCLTLNNLQSNIWISTSLINSNASGNNACLGGGNVTLSGTLDRIRITTVNGTDTFDAGQINIMYEG